MAQRTNEASLWQKANETELKDIQAKLDGFYGPFMQMSEANRLLAQELRDRQPDRETYRLIAKVFDKEWLERLPPGDRTIVREVCQNAAGLEAFIRERQQWSMTGYFRTSLGRVRIIEFLSWLTKEIWELTRLIT